jgi:hypothetical protein
MDEKRRKVVRGFQTNRGKEEVKNPSAVQMVGVNNQ